MKVVVGEVEFDRQNRGAMQPAARATNQRNEIRLALLRLNGLDRYEQRAAWARNKALRLILAADRNARADGD